jgi:hypothetical protein
LPPGRVGPPAGRGGSRARAQQGRLGRRATTYPTKRCGKQEPRLQGGTYKTLGRVVNQAGPLVPEAQLCAQSLPLCSLFGQESGREGVVSAGVDHRGDGQGCWSWGRRAPLGGATAEYFRSGRSREMLAAAAGEQPALNQGAAYRGMQLRWEPCCQLSIELADGTPQSTSQHSVTMPLIVMCGLPCSGKSTRAAELAAYFAGGTDQAAGTGAGVEAKEGGGKAGRGSASALSLSLSQSLFLLLLLSVHLTQLTLPPFSGGLKGCTSRLVRP